MMEILERLIHGEPIAAKAWTVYYYDRGMTSRILKFLFGLRGCHRQDCDDLLFRQFPEGFAVMVNKDTDGCNYIWILQMEKYVCNFGFSKIMAAAKDHAVEMMKRSMQAQFESQMQGIVPNVEPEAPILKGEMYG